MKYPLHELIGTEKEILSPWWNVECESRDSSVSFALFSSLTHSRHFILNFKIKKFTSNQLTYTHRKLTLCIIKSIFSWDQTQILFTINSRPYEYNKMCTTPIKNNSCIKYIDTIYKFLIPIMILATTIHWWIKSIERLGKKMTEKYYANSHY